MESLIVEWLKENAPLVLAFIVGGFCCVWGYRIYDRLVKRIDDCEKENKDTTVALNKLQKEMEGVRDNVKSIKDYLVGRDQRVTNIFAMKRSPRMLNENGKQIYNIIKGDEFLDKNEGLLLEKLAEKHPRTALDVELSAKEVLFELLSDPVFDEIKDIVYNAPSIQITVDDKVSEYGFTISDVCFVLSLPLRDKYLESHKDIEISEEE